jgi:zinc transport system substrate-binding protein
MVFHPAWGYFAETYGLTQVPIEKEGKEPGARALAALIEQARREQVKVIFVQPQFSRRSAEQVARAIGGQVVAIDPLAPDYADNLRQAARSIAAAVRR